MTRLATRIAIAGLGAVLLGAAGFAGLRGVAALLTAEVEARTAQGPAAKSVSGAEPLMSAAHSLAPPLGTGADAALAAALAELAFLRFQAGDPGTTPDSVIDGFRRVIGLRPSWGRAWARYCYVKAVFRQFDDEMAFCLAQSHRLAPLEHDVVAMNLQTGLMAWYELPQDTRKVVWQMVRGALDDAKMRRVAIDLAGDYGLADYVTPYVDVDGASGARPAVRAR